MKPESKRVIRHVQQNFDHSIWTINDRKCLSKALKSLSVDEIKANAKHIFENKSPLEIDCFIKRLHHSRESYTKIKNCNPEFKYIDCINLWSQLMYDIIGDKAHDNTSLMIGKLMSLIGNNEVPKHSEKTNGVNYKDIYDYLACVLMGLPAPPLKPLESAVILELLETMLCKMSVSNLEAHKKMLLWKYDALTGKHGGPSKQQVQRALENDFQFLDTTDLSESARKKLLEPEQKLGKQQELLHQLLTKRSRVVKKPKPKHVVKEETDKNSTVIYEIQHIDELLPDGTKATVVKLNPIIVSLADPTMKALWVNNEEPTLATDSEENSKKTTRADDNEKASQSKEMDTASKYSLQMDTTSSADLGGVVAGFSRSQETVKYPGEEDDAISGKLKKTEDYSQSFPRPLNSLMLMPDALWINPFCIPPHLIGIEVSEINQ
ncbi:Hypothetical predicted protein [Octopus vulgaris]|nr:Hypothetical predicted protein [Octopus vulgaris]